MSLPKSAWKRGSMLLKTATKLAYKELESKVSATPLGKKIEQAQELVNTLSQMKGAAMKVGQLLSLDATDLFPPEVVNILGQLQSDSKSLPYHEIEMILKTELGENNFKRINKIEERPLAAASIGQVHRAEIDGKMVVFKIQYPGIAETIDSDIKLLEKIFNQFLFISGKRNININSIMNELKESLILETDYKQEANFLMKYKKNFSEDSRFIIPSVDLEFSTKNILCLEYCRGIPLRSWLESNPKQEDLDLLGKYALELYLKEFYHWGLVQTDPNFGNFLIQENPLRIVLLDFGSTKEYTQEFISAYKKLIIACFYGKDEEIIKYTFEMNLIDKRESQATLDLYLEMMKAIIEPFQSEDKFDFANSEYVQKTRDLSIDFTQALKFSAPPKDLIFLHRKLGGIFGLMKRCKTKIALRPYLLDIFNS